MDLLDLASFDRFLLECRNCGAYWPFTEFLQLEVETDRVARTYERTKDEVGICPVCEYPSTPWGFEDDRESDPLFFSEIAHRYKEADSASFGNETQRCLANAFSEMGFSLVNVTDSLTSLPRVAKYFKQASGDEQILAGIDLLQSAQHFIHFTAYNMDLAFWGILLGIARRGIQVRGVIGHEESFLKWQLYKQFSSWRNAKILLDNNPAKFRRTHQKLVVIDGLVALFGGANLTFNAWSNASNDKVPHDSVELEADFPKVQALHNKYFSPTFNKVLVSERTRTTS